MNEAILKEPAAITEAREAIRQAAGRHGEIVGAQGRLLAQLAEKVAERDKAKAGYAEALAERHLGWRPDMDAVEDYRQLYEQIEREIAEMGIIEIELQRLARFYEIQGSVGGWDNNNTIRIKGWERAGRPLSWDS